LIGLDLVVEASDLAQNESQKTAGSQTPDVSEQMLEYLGDPDSIWVGSSLGYRAGDRVQLLINDQVHGYTVRGVYADSNGNESAIVMDLTAAQHALARFGRVDRILLKVPQTPSLEEWQQRLQTVLPGGVATGAVRLMSATVESLYVSSRPGIIELDTASVFLAFAIGVGVAVASAYSPAREASTVSPVEAMARGRREYNVRVQKGRDLWMAVLLGLAAAAASRAPAVAGKPLLGYLAAILLVVASALTIPAFVHTLTSLSSKLLGKLLGVEAMLASRSLAASLRRASVLV